MLAEREYEYGVSDWRNVRGRNIRTSGCILLFCEEGMAIVSVDFKRRSVRKGDIVLIFPDTMFVVNDVSELFRIKYMEFSSSLFEEATFTLSSQFFNVVYGTPIFPTSLEQRKLLEAWEVLFLGMVQRSSPGPVCGAYMMLRNHLQNFFIEMENIVLSESVATYIQPISTARQLFNRFCRLLVEHCRSRHDVRFYAEKLCVSPYYLSKITGKTLGLAPKELIARQIVMEMKWLLTTTDMSVKELASCFHFDTVSYMARFFRRYTGLTPGAFRRR